MLGDETRVRILLLALAAGLWLGCGASPEDQVQATARKYAQRFFDGDLAGLHGLFTPEFAKDMPFTQFAEVHRSVVEQLGRETEVLSESVEVKPPYHRYLRRSRFERFDGLIEANWILRDDGRSIAGIVFRPVETRPAGETQ